MKAAELRIGNWVQYNERSYYAIEDGADIDAAEIFHSVPLTDEWLQKFGFIKTFVTPAFRSPLHYKKLRDDTSDMLTLRPYFMGGYLWGHSESEEDFPIEMGSPIGIEYVHHLQNLYYALTGEELTIK